MFSVIFVNSKLFAILTFIIDRFPRNPDTLKKWEDWVNTVNELNSKKKFKVYTDAVLCNFHFDSLCYKFGQLQQGSVPSIHLL